MEKLAMYLDKLSLSADQKQENCQMRKLNVQRCIQSLIHVIQCQDAKCLPSCEKMKRVVQHTKICKRQVNGGCPICKSFVALCCYHAKHCQKSKCSVCFCRSIKLKMKKVLLQEELQVQLMFKRMAIRNTRGYQTANVGNAGLRQPNPQLMQPNQPGAQGPNVGALRQAQPGQNPQNKQALQQLLQIMKSQSPNTPEQQQQILQILKSNPQLMAAFIKQRATFQQMQQQLNETENVNVNVW